MQHDNTTMPQSWWQRNWKWVVPSGCLGMLVIAGLFVGAIFYGVTSVMKNSDVYKEAMIKVQSNSLLKTKLGPPIEGNGMVSGSIQTNNYSGSADVYIPIKGTKGEGVVHVVALKENNIWSYSVIKFYVEGDADGIDLLP